jgi:16S rRNA (adenine1518-N6/adenine1519-N6)-dimethyltransferase
MDLCDIRQVKALLARHGFHFSKSLGQNFLIESWVPQDIAATSQASAENAVLEIGPGIGPLTRQLAAHAGKVVCLELDTSLQPILAETLSDCPNTEVIFGDITKQDCRQLVAEHMSGYTPIVCANLPYNITTPVITQLLESGVFRSITVMIQKEVAKRICATPGTADFGAFTLLCQYYAKCEYCFEVPKECFLPAPKVTSAVVRMELLDKSPVQVQDSAVLFRVIRAAFAQRRKTLSNALSSGFPELGKERIATCISNCGLPSQVRGEKLGLEEFAALADAIFAML